MTGWDVLNNVVSGFPPVAFMLLLIASITAAIIFIVGFSRHGTDFIKHGFRQNLLSELTAALATKEDINKLESDFQATKLGIGKLESDFQATKLGIGKLESELQNIKVNHFGHLKNYLGVLNSILLDQDIINNESKARLDNELRGM